MGCPPYERSVTANAFAIQTHVHFVLAGTLERRPASRRPPESCISRRMRRWWTRPEFLREILMTKTSDRAVHAALCRARRSYRHPWISCGLLACLPVDFGTTGRRSEQSRMKSERVFLIVALAAPEERKHFRRRAISQLPRPSTQFASAWSRLEHGRRVVRRTRSPSFPRLSRAGVPFLGGGHW